MLSRFVRAAPFAVLAAALPLGLTACASARPPKASAPIAKSAAPTEPSHAALAPGHLARADVDQVLRQGPPWILRRVRTEEVLRENKFIGWRVLELPSEWSSIDLKPGDVITLINGMPLEKPDDFFSAWSSLAVASDLRVAYDRSGASRELTYHIDGASSEPPPSLRADAPPPPKPAPNGPPRKTVVIVGDDPIDDGAE
jgi:hypothetical protein